MRLSQKYTRQPLMVLAVLLLLLSAGIAFTAWSYLQIAQASEQRRYSRNILGQANGFCPGSKTLKLASAATP
ncbi:MAG: hypothetical protein IPN53_24360 [Comamonadaceae bacterium]|nr:hypothetical protein [Comamonadaceae bacterium]